MTVNFRDTERALLLSQSGTYIPVPRVGDSVDIYEMTYRVYHISWTYSQESAMMAVATVFITRTGTSRS